MTFAGRMPHDVEDLLADSINFGLEEQEVLEDTVSKIDDYRMLFGAGEFQSNRSNESFSALDKIIQE